MLNTPGEDDQDTDLELDFEGMDGPGPAPEINAEEADALDDCAPLDDERPQVGYELFDWDPTELDDLDDALHELGLPHEWVSDGYEVVVHEVDEERLDTLLPTIRFPDELAPEVDDGDDTDVEVLSALFVAADRMVRDATGEPVRAMLDAAERLGDHPPYGVSEPEWVGIVEDVDELLDALHAAAPPAAVEDLARRMRDRLRPLV